jgi:Fur family ferric uptake transcriptional regulator
MPNDRVEEILGRFRAGGGRVTEPRRAVVHALVASTHHHVTVPALLQALRQVDPDVHESTVYRTLDRLADLGVVTPIEQPGGPTVYHLPERAHHHLVCEGCGRIVGASPDLLTSVGERLAAEHGFALRHEAVTLPGLCAECAGAAGGRSTWEPGGAASIDRH